MAYGIVEVVNGATISNSVPIAAGEIALLVATYDGTTIILYKNGTGNTPKVVGAGVTRVFRRRSIRAGYVARHLNTGSIRVSRVLPAQRLDGRIHRLIFLRALERIYAAEKGRGDD